MPRGVTYWDRVPLSVDVSAAVLCSPELHPSPKEEEEEEEEEEEVEEEERRRDLGGM